MWFQPLKDTRITKHIKCKHSNMEKINVINVKISFNDREDVKNTTSMHMETYENLECCNCAKVVTRKRSQLVHTLSKHATKIRGV